MPHTLSRLPLLFLLLCLLASCRKGRPDGVPSAGKMEDILVDVHLAGAMAERAHYDSLDFYTRLYTDAALEKHGMTPEDFQRALAYYIRHTRQLDKMYDHITERLGEGSGEGDATFAKDYNSLDGDTLNLWNGTDFYLLSNITGTGRMDFRVQNDSLLDEDCRLLFLFHTEWVQHEGTRQGAAALCARYDNDSVAVQTYRIPTSGRQQITLLLRPTPHRIVSVEGFIYQQSLYTERPRLLIVRNPALLRILPKNRTAPAATPSLVGDSAAVPRDTLPSATPAAEPAALPAGAKGRRAMIRDSLLNDEKQNATRSHFQ